MSNEKVEKRKSSRVFFNMEEEITATISSIQETDQSIPVTILSIGTGGLSFMVNRYKLPKVKERDRLALSSINTPSPLGPIEHIEAVVKYILDFQHSVRLSLGCEFLQNPEPLIKKIEKYVQLRLKKQEIDR
jgi:hypothetical protein